MCASRLVRSANTSLVQYANELALGQRVRAQTGGRIIAQWCIFLCVREREKECVCPNACLELCDCLCVVTWLWVSAMCPYPNSGAICGSAYTSQLLNNHDLINPVMKGWRKQNQSKNTPPPQKKKKMCLLFCKFSQNKVFCQICTLCRFWYKQQHASWLKTAVSLHQAWNGKPYLEVMKADGSGGKLNQSLD